MKNNRGLNKNIVGVGIVFGSALGAGLGVAMNNIPIMAGTGAIMGIIAGTIIWYLSQRG